jgi:hypothetical protein
MVYIHLASHSKTSTQRHRKWLEASHHKLQGAIEVQTVQGAMEVVKRLEIWDETIAFTLWKGWSVGGNTEKCDRPSISSALYNQSLHRNGGSRYYL